MDQSFEQRNNVDWFQPITLNNYNPSTNLRFPFDLTGCSLKMQLVGAESGMTTLLLSTGNGYLIITPPGTLGQCTIQVPATVMWTLEAGMYTADMLITKQDGSVILGFSSTVEIIQGDTAP